MCPLAGHALQDQWGREAVGGVPGWVVGKKINQQSPEGLPSCIQDQWGRGARGVPERVVGKKSISSHMGVCLLASKISGVGGRGEFQSGW